MIRPILALVALALAAGFQGALTAYVPAAAAVIDLLLIVAIYYALHTNQVNGMCRSPMSCPRSATPS